VGTGGTELDEPTALASAPGLPDSLLQPSNKLPAPNAIENSRRFISQALWKACVVTQPHTRAAARQRLPYTLSQSLGISPNLLRQTLKSGKGTDEKKPAERAFLRREKPGAYFLAQALSLAFSALEQSTFLSSILPPAWLAAKAGADIKTKADAITEIKAFIRHLQ
jgi:hypothetical protein